MSAKVTMKKFLKWADDKITVSWCQGSLCNSEPLEFFDPENNEDVLDFLNRVVDWVDENEYRKDKEDGDEPNQFVFSLFNEELGEEYDEYQEELFTPEELLEIYHKTVNYKPNAKENVERKKLMKLLDEFQDILLDDKDFEKADEFMKKHNIDLNKDCMYVMDNAIGYWDAECVEFLLKRNMRLSDKMMKQAQEVLKREPQTVVIHGGY